MNITTLHTSMHFIDFNHLTDISIMLMPIFVFILSIYCIELLLKLQGDDMLKNNSIWLLSGFSIFKKKSAKIIYKDMSAVSGEKSPS